MGARNDGFGHILFQPCESKVMNGCKRRAARRWAQLFSNRQTASTAVARPYIEADVFGYTCLTTPIQRAVKSELSFIGYLLSAHVTLQLLHCVHSGLRAETGFCPTINHGISLIPYPIILFSSCR
jgi:hypothetical protein